MLSSVYLVEYTLHQNLMTEIYTRYFDLHITVPSPNLAFLCRNLDCPNQSINLPHFFPLPSPLLSNHSFLSYPSVPFYTSFHCLPPSLHLLLLFATSAFIPTPPSLPAFTPTSPSFPFSPSSLTFSFFYHSLRLPFTAFLRSPPFTFSLPPSLSLPPSHPTKRYLSLSFSTLPLFFFPFLFYPILIPLSPLPLFPTSLSPIVVFYT